MRYSHPTPWSNKDNNRAGFFNPLPISTMLALLSDVRLDHADAALAGIVTSMTANFICERWCDGTVMQVTLMLVKSNCLII
jgi:hypothetical protein